MQRAAGKINRRAIRNRRPEPSLAGERMLRKGYENALRLLESMAELVAQQVPTFFQQATDIRQDSLTRDVEEFMARLRTQVNSRVVGMMATQAAAAAGFVQRESAEALSAQLGSIFGVQLNTALLDQTTRPRVENMVRENVRLVQRLTDDQAERLTQIITNAGYRGDTSEALAAKIRDEFTRQGDFVSRNRNRADFIARDQIGKFRAAVEQVRQEELGIEGYYWRSQRDERVRPFHQALDAERRIHRWDDPPPDPDGYPGEPPGCRCWPEPALAPLVED